jgi:hypothetical protein
MMANSLKIAAPPARRTVSVEPAAASVPAAATPKFDQVKEGERVQFNKRVTRGVADGFEMLAIKTRRKVPDLLAEALDVLQERYGKV